MAGGICITFSGIHMCKEEETGGGLGTLMNVIPTTRPRFGGDLLKVSMETISASTGRG